MAYRIVQLGCLIAMLCWQAYALTTIKQIEVQGNKRIEKEVIIYYSGLKLGTTPTSAMLNKSTESLYETNFFKDIQLNLQASGVLVINVKENSLISKIHFKNNKVFSKDDLLKEIKAKENTYLAESIVSADIKKIISLYQQKGYFLTRVVAKYVPQEEGLSALIYDIEEGKRSFINNIYFMGNEFFSGFSLRGVMNSKESSILNIFAFDSFNQDLLNQDTDSLIQLYQTRGFPDAQVSLHSVILASNKKEFDIYIKINEGDRYRFDNFEARLESPKINTKALLDDLYDYIDFNVKGDWYNIATIQDYELKIQNYLLSKGHPFFRVVSSSQRDEANKVIKITFDIRELPVYQQKYIEKININNNFLIKDNVIRRELFIIGEGDPFNPYLLNEARRKVFNLGYFKNVDITNRSGTNNTNEILELTVEEKPTTTFNFQLGYGGSSNFSAQFNLKEQNFWGEGWGFNTGFSLSTSNISAALGFSNPYLFGNRLSYFNNFYFKRSKSQDYQAYNAKGELVDQQGASRLSFGVANYLGFYLSDNWQLQFGYDYKYSFYKNTSFNLSPITFQSLLGKLKTSSIGVNLLHSDLDNNYQPTSGRSFSIRSSFAGVGGNIAYIQLDLNASFYRSYGPVVANMDISAGKIIPLSDRLIPSDDKYSLGYLNLRGFSQGSIGVKDLGTIGSRYLNRSNNTLGGENYWLIKNELSLNALALRQLSVTPLLFLDMGMAWGLTQKYENPFRYELLGGYIEGTSLVYDSLKLRMSVGLGFKWQNPIFPIQVYFAYPLMYQKADPNFRKGYDDPRKDIVRYVTIGTGVNF